MKYLYFDTETSGFAKTAGTPLEEQPHIVQLAVLLTGDDVPDRGFNFIVKPDGWTIPDDVVAVHGITMEKAAAHGVPLRVAITAFSHMCRAADVIVAHNISFDLKMVDFEIRRLGFENVLDGKRRFCTMRESIDLCRLPGQYPGKWKFPKLIEAHMHFFGEGFEGQHDALADVRACARIHRHLLSQNTSFLRII